MLEVSDSNILTTVVGQRRQLGTSSVINVIHQLVYVAYFVPDLHLLVCKFVQVLYCFFKRVN